MKLFGTSEASTTIQNVEDFVKEFGAGSRFSNAAKSLTAFINRYTKPLPINKDLLSNFSINKATCMEVIEDFCGINKHVIEGMIHSADCNAFGVKEALVELFRLKN